MKCDQLIIEDSEKYGIPWNLHCVRKSSLNTSTRCYVLDVPGVMYLTVVMYLNEEVFRNKASFWVYIPCCRHFVVLCQFTMLSSIREFVWVLERRPHRKLVSSLEQQMR